MARDGLGMPAELVGDDVASGSLAEVRRVGEDAPGAVLSVVRRPHVHGLLNCALAALREGKIDDGKALARAFQFQLVTDLALDGALHEDVRWAGPAPGGALLSPTHGVYAELTGQEAGFRFGPGSAVIEGQDGEVVLAPGQSPETFVPVSTESVLSLVDNNPISDFEAHPDKEGNTLSCGDAEPQRWAASITAALDCVETYLPELRAEMAMILQLFVPVGTDDKAHLSASYRELIGHVYLTLHPRQMTMTEAVIHEYQHNKINMLFHLDPVMDNAFHPLYPSPVRPDPRPLHGVLLAAHAFVPVAELYRRMVAAGDPECARPGFDRRFREIIASNDEAVSVLREHAKPTDAGREVLDELFSIHESHLVLHD
jgi:HEXXH motif-containing protein